MPRIKEAGRRRPGTAGRVLHRRVNKPYWPGLEIPEEKKCDGHSFSQQPSELDAVSDAKMKSQHNEVGLERDVSSGRSIDSNHDEDHAKQKEPAATAMLQPALMQKPDVDAFDAKKGREQIAYYERIILELQEEYADLLELSAMEPLAKNVIELKDIRVNDLKDELKRRQVTILEQQWKVAQRELMLGHRNRSVKVRTEEFLMKEEEVNRLEEKVMADLEHIRMRETDSGQATAPVQKQSKKASCTLTSTVATSHKGENSQNEKAAEPLKMENDEAKASAVAQTSIGEKSTNKKRKRKKRGKKTETMEQTHMKSPTTSPAMPTTSSASRGSPPNSKKRRKNNPNRPGVSTPNRAPTPLKASAKPRQTPHRQRRNGREKAKSPSPRKKSQPLKRPIGFTSPETSKRSSRGCKIRIPTQALLDNGDV